MSPRSIVEQGCPICGRPLEIQVEYLGRRVACQHCGGQFLATDPTSRPQPAGQRSPNLLGRAERLLDLAARRLAVGGCG